jgi:hypothetical protein
MIRRRLAQLGFSRNDAKGMRDAALVVVFSTQTL